MKEKIPFKEYPLVHKVIIPACYGMTALWAVLTAYAIKQHDREKMGRSFFGTSLFASWAISAHSFARMEVREDRKRKQRS